jgi:hypothetical protein
MAAAPAAAASMPASAPVSAATAMTGGKLDARALGVFLVEDVEGGQAHIGDFLLGEQHSGVVLPGACGTR